MFITNVGYTSLLLSSCILITQCAASTNFAGKVPGPLLDHEEENNDNGPTLAQMSPVDMIDFSTLSKQIRDDIQKMRAEIDNNFGKSLDEVPELTTFTKASPTISSTQDNKNDTVDVPETKSTMPTIQTKAKTDPQVRHDSPFKLMKPGKRINDENFDFIRHPLDIAKIFQRLEELPLPMDDMFGPGIFEGNPIFDNLNGGGENPANIGEPVFKPSDNDQDLPELFPIGEIIHIRIPVEDANSGQMNSEQQSPTEKKFMDDFVNRMKNMISTLQEAVLPDTDLSGDQPPENTAEPDGQRLKITIVEHGAIYNIPSNANLERDNTGMVNITWRSVLPNINNSLCVQVSRDGTNYLVFQYVNLRLIRGKSIHEYTMDGPFHLRDTNESSSITLKLNDDVLIKFGNHASLNSLVAERKERASAPWLVFSILMVGLIVTGLVLLLSYIMHRRNYMYARKESLSKEPIA